jgi:serine/threonine protein kinase
MAVPEIGETKMVFEQHDLTPTATNHYLSATMATSSVMVEASNTSPALDDRPFFRHSMSNATTAPIRIASPSPCRIPSRGRVPAPAHNEKLDFNAVRERAARKKERARRDTTPVPLAVHTVRGFHTPGGTAMTRGNSSNGEDSDGSGTSTPMFGGPWGRMRSQSTQLGMVGASNVSVTSSPYTRPQTPSQMSGISALKLKLESLSLGRAMMSPPMRSSSLHRMQSNGSGTSEPNSETESGTETESYEVPLRQDFISSDLTKSPRPIPVRAGLGIGASASATPRSASVAPTPRKKMSAVDFEPITCLGKGTYGTVLLVRQHSTGRLFAQKQLKKASLVVRKKLVEQTKTERAILEQVNRHPFVVKLFYAFQDAEKLYLILEYAQGGELFHHLSMERMFDEDTAAFYMAEMVLALSHLHSNLGVVYRDLKPENCLLDVEGHLLLTDFGLSKVPVDDADRCKSFMGTVEYMAPEIIQGKEYDAAVDWWSLGALGHDLLTGSPPFTAASSAKVQDRIVKAKLKLPYYLGPDAKDLITRLLRKEPKKRLGGNMPKDLAIIKKHRFFRKIDWEKLARREMTPPIQPVVTDPVLAENFDTEFTGLRLSVAIAGKLRVDEENDAFERDGMVADTEEENPFGGFSFVASSSLLDEKMDWE